MATFGRSTVVFLLWILATTAAPTHAQSVRETNSLESDGDHWLVARNATPDFSGAAGALFGSVRVPKDSCFNNTLLISDASLRADDSPANFQVAKSASCEDRGKSTPLQFTLLPVNPCGSYLLMGSSTTCFPLPSVGLSFRPTRLLAADSSLLAARPPRERFHWGPALLQSVEFLLLEHGFRLANDPYARYLLFHKPFWKDYLSSAGNFDMSRWGDGDDFLVNYIGHSLEGSVSGNIFIQNDPQGRSAKFGKSSAYWASRFKAMAWAAVYSAYFEIGPVLSETALGNEGGYTYVPHCGFYPTCPKAPDETYKPPTNNTGWVDFIVTPTIGMGWIVLEDFLEADLVDKLADGRDSAKFNILRGALSPSRSMSNMLAGKPPWHRPTGPREVVEAFGAPLRPVPEWPAWRDDPRWSLGVHLTSASFPLDWEGCNGCRALVPGVGIGLGYRLSRLMYFDSEFNVFPGSGSPGARGGAEEGLFGVKVGRTGRSWGVFTQLRPGFVHFEKSLVAGSTTDYESATRFAFDFGGSVEYYASHHSTIRVNVGTTLIHYLTGQPDPKQPPVSVLSSDYYTTLGSFRVTSGYVFRF
jgi:hypothetical protein